MILSHTVSELSQLNVQILDTAFWSPLWGLRDNVRCSSLAHWKARSGLPISVNWTFSLGVTAEALWAKIDRKPAISLQRGQFDQKFQVEGVAPTNYFARIVSGISYNFVADSFHTKKVKFVADFLQAKCDFKRKTAVLRFWVPFWRAH